jgi:hypothetical protein
MVKKSKRWTQEDIDGFATVKGKKAGGRYANVRKPVHDGIRFDSKREFLRYMDLTILVRAGEIKDLKVHPKYPITIAGVEIRIYSKRYHKTGRHLTYEADFEYQRFVTGCPDSKTKAGIWVPVIEDVKMASGHRTEVYKIKKALMLAMGHIIEEYT